NPVMHGSFLSFQSIPAFLLQKKIPAEYRAFHPQQPVDNQLMQSGLDMSDSVDKIGHKYAVPDPLPCIQYHQLKRPDLPTLLPVERDIPIPTRSSGYQSDGLLPCPGLF